jgi:rhodanese-related sulfurtransferase
MARCTLDDLLETARSKIERLAPGAAWAAAQDGARIIDVRAAPDEVVAGSLHIPRTVLEWRLDPDSRWRSPFAPALDDTVLVLCDHGCSSSLAAAVLVELGFGKAGDVVGGFAAWVAAGLPAVAAPAPAPGLPGTAPPAPLTD